MLREYQNTPTTAAAAAPQSAARATVLPSKTRWPDREPYSLSSPSSSSSSSDEEEVEEVEEDDDEGDDDDGDSDAQTPPNKHGKYENIHPTILRVIQAALERRFVIPVLEIINDMMKVRVLMSSTTNAFSFAPESLRFTLSVTPPAIVSFLLHTLTTSTNHAPTLSLSPHPNPNPRPTTTTTTTLVPQPSTAATVPSSTTPPPTLTTWKTPPRHCPSGNKSSICGTASRQTARPTRSNGPAAGPWLWLGRERG